jgi:hypothetical protein
MFNAMSNPRHVLHNTLREDCRIGHSALAAPCTHPSLRKMFNDQELVCNRLTHTLLRVAAVSLQGRLADAAVKGIIPPGWKTEFLCTA